MFVITFLRRSSNYDYSFKTHRVFTQEWLTELFLTPLSALPCILYRRINSLMNAHKSEWLCLHLFLQCFVAIFLFTGLSHKKVNCLSFCSFCLIVLTLNDVKAKHHFHFHNILLLYDKKIQHKTISKWVATFLYSTENIILWNFPKNHNAGWICKNLLHSYTF